VLKKEVNRYLVAHFGCIAGLITIQIIFINTLVSDILEQLNVDFSGMQIENNVYVFKRL